MVRVGSSFRASLITLAPKAPHRSNKILIPLPGSMISPREIEVEPRGFEPLTPAMPLRCSTN